MALMWRSGVVSLLRHQTLGFASRSSKITVYTIVTDYARQPENKGDGENKGLAAYRFHVDPNDKDTYPDDTAVGYADGNNLVVCNFAIRRYAPLKTYDPKPAPGQPFEQYKWTYGSMFVHEFSHIFGTLDSSVYEYGYTASTQLVSDTIAGKSKDKSVTPGMFADSYSFLALGKLKHM